LSSAAIKGDLLALAGALSGALYLIIGRATRKAMTLIPYITLIYAVAAATLLVVAAFSGYTFTGYSPQMYLWFLLLAIFPQLLAHSTYNWALKYLSATSVSLSLLGEPVAAAVLAHLILGESLPALRWISAVVVLVGIAFAFFRPKPALQGISKIYTINKN
jgi:drug/metabolite transporter (DMT)-like permease